MSVPKSKKLQREEQQFQTQFESRVEDRIDLASAVMAGDPVTIRPVKCHNDFVAILQATIQTTIDLAGAEGQFKNEGVVIGVGPGIADGAGGRLKPSVAIGEYVMFGPRNIVATLEPNDGLYKGKKVVVVSERNILCSLPSFVEIIMEE